MNTLIQQTQTTFDSSVKPCLVKGFKTQFAVLKGRANQAYCTNKEDETDAESKNVAHRVPWSGYGTVKKKQKH